MSVPSLTVFVVLAAWGALAQQQSTSGQVTSTSCTTADGTTCAIDGSTNEIVRNLTYSTATGKFTGTIVTNLCSNNKYGRDSGGNVMGNGQGGHTASCKQQTFPAPAYTRAPPIAAPLRGVVGYSLYGVAIYGPFEAGFSAGQGCDVNAGTCSAGLDISTCEAKLALDCGGVSHVRTGIDSCGGHATPYHYHIEMKCDETLNSASSTWTANSPSGHSPLVGLMLDGRGLYGIYESTGQQPTDLDACGGHTGPVPVISVSGVSGHADTSVYHYHSQTRAPFLLGCYGPVSSVAACSALYSTCGTGYESFNTTSGAVDNYDLDCPCAANSAATSSPPTSAPATSNPPTAVPSTAAPTTSTSAPTTAAPLTSTVAPATAAPVTSTAAPVTSTAAPATDAPVTTTPAPAVTTSTRPPPTQPSSVSSVAGCGTVTVLAVAAALLTVLL